MTLGRRLHRSARGLTAAVVGVLAVAAGVALPQLLPRMPVDPQVQELVFVLGGTILVAGVLDVLLSPGQSTPPGVATAIQAARTTEIESELEAAGATERRVYVPDGDRALLYVPVRGDEAPPDNAGSARLADGVTVAAVGAELLSELDDDHRDRAPDRVVAWLADVATGRFELVDTAVPVETTRGRVTVALGGSRVGSPGDCDHPAVSLLGVGLATAIDTPVTAAVTTTENDAEVTLTWR